MDVATLMNSPGLWIACGIMVAVVVGQSIVFFRAALKQAPNVGLTKDQTRRGIRAAIITAIGPSMSPVIIMMSLIAVLGAPTAWMRMNDIGASRTELAMSTLAVEATGGVLSAGTLTMEQFTAAVWGMGLNNLGWMLIALLLTHRMSKAIHKLNTNFSPIWIKMMMAGATFGLFSYLTGNAVVGKAFPFLVSALAAGASMFIISTVFKKFPLLQEPALGISMIVGMASASIVASMG